MHFNGTRHLLRVTHVLRYSPESVFAWRAVGNNLWELLKLTSVELLVRALFVLN